MRAILICLLLGGCAGPPAARDCPALPTLKAGAVRADMINHIRVTADLYARCAARP
ncbi:protein of unknown function [Cupriavidus neocaledonicus]|uniref:Lipoprotein n=1 Tax=Cupriavidus neocaledonicus TaxID=1040979 RepID=A0A375HB63_9BURK|nr:protein of unknown function [Cupriavidus neocaledonicus]